MKNDGRVSASEIGEFIYCKKGWYLRNKGLLKQNDLMREGILQHNAQFLSVEKLTIGKILALGFIIIGAVLILMYFLVQNFLSL